MFTFRNLLLLVIFLFGLLIYLLFEKEYIYAILPLAGIIFLIPISVRRLNEELVLYISLIQGYSEEKINKTFRRGIQRAMIRLEQKGTIKIEDNRIQLMDNKYKLSISKSKKYR